MSEKRQLIIKEETIDLSEKNKSSIIHLPTLTDLSSKEIKATHEFLTSEKLDKYYAEFIEIYEFNKKFVIDEIKKIDIRNHILDQSKSGKNTLVLEINICKLNRFFDAIVEKDNYDPWQKFCSIICLDTEEDDDLIEIKEDVFKIIVKKFLKIYLKKKY